MSRTHMREVLNAVKPDGAAWNPAYDGDFDRLLNGIAKNYQEAVEKIEKLAYIRDPEKAPLELMGDLEREFGIASDNNKIDKIRRKTLAAIRYKNNQIATDDKLQRALDLAGFGSGGDGVKVVRNESPAIDPGDYIGYQNKNYYLANSDNYSVKLQVAQAGQICARNPNGSDWRSGIESAGYYNENDEQYIRHPTPPQEYWPLVFFVCGGAERGEGGMIVSLSQAIVPKSRRQELNRIVLSIKPVAIWAAMLITYT